VLARSHHPRAYLLPSQHTRKKWEEPTFKPAMNPRSLVSRRRSSLYTVKRTVVCCQPELPPKAHSRAAIGDPVEHP
jgi:hypothetical protein